MTLSHTQIAQVLQSAANKLPTLTPGEPTLEVIRNFEICCRAYFTHKNVPKEEQVRKIAWGVQEPRIQNWYIANQDKINVLDFDDCIQQL